MGQIANYPNGFAYGLNIRGLPLSQSHPGKVFWVGNSTVLMDNQKAASNGNDGSFLAPYSTVDYAIGRCLANRGDVIFVKPGHAETLSAASAITSDVAGVSIIGLGTGAKRPTFTWSTDTAATWVVSAANTTITNIIGICNIDALVKAFSVTGASAHLDIEWQDQTNIEAARVVLTTADADKLYLKLRYLGYTGGDACVAPVQLVGTDGARIELDFYGKASTAVVNMITTASTDVEVSGTVYNSGTTDGSKNVVDTQGSSTWYMDVVDAAAGARYTGGSASAVASDDITAITNALYGTAGIASWAASAAPGNNVSISEALRAVYDNVSGIDGATNVLGADDADNGFASTNVVGNADGSVLERLEYVQATGLAVPSADATTNTTGRDVVGNKTDASVYVPGTQKSLAAYSKGTADLQERVAKKAAATITNGQTLFTVAGGPIIVLGLVSICETANDATASTVQYNATPTSGSAQTISAASASIANAAAGASISLIGTALTTAALYNANGPNLGMTNMGGIMVPAGTITAVVGIGSTTGTWAHYLRYKPLATGVTVS